MSSGSSEVEQEPQHEQTAQADRLGSFISSDLSYLGLVVLFGSRLPGLFEVNDDQILIAILIRVKINFVRKRQPGLI